MAVPDFQTLMLPTLIAVSSKSVSNAKDVIGAVAKSFSLTPEDLALRLPSGTQRVIDNRVYWCLIYLDRAGMIERPARGHYSLTDLGRKTLDSKPGRIDVKYLNQFENFRKFHKGTKSEKGPSELKEADNNGSDPLEGIETSYDKLKAGVCGELLKQLRVIEPGAFEHVVLELLRRMGYGLDGGNGTIHKGGPGDGGVDGEISQDSLGLDMIYVQAKRYQEGSGVGRPAIQQFVGSLNERKAKKGVFITTSHFSSDAEEYVDRVDMKVVLIDGERLAALMFDHNLGVVVEQKYEVKKIDSDYFEAA